jgi:uncharacterized protein DUF4329/PAAR motif-containing protein
MPAARATDMCVCVGPPDAIAKGSPTVLIGSLMAARLGDPTMHGGLISVGLPTVMIGEAGSGSPGGAAGGAPGGAAGGGAAGSGAAGKNGPFATPDLAAKAALQAANPQSIKDNKEYSGLIYRGADGQYYYTGPVGGTGTGANPKRDAPPPAGSTVVGDYHTHGDYSTADAKGNPVRTNDPSKDAFDSDNFSDQDKLDNDAEGYPGYLGTPSGTFRKYDPATKTDTVL